MDWFTSPGVIAAAFILLMLVTIGLAGLWVWLGETRDRMQMVAHLRDIERRAEELRQAVRR